MAKQDAKDQPCWSTLSEELAAVLREKGPVLIGEVAVAYISVHRKSLRLHGHKLRECLDKGHIRGIEFNSELGRLELEEGAGVETNAVGAAPNAPTTVRENLSHGKLPAKLKRLELETGAGVASNAPTTVRTKLDHGKLPAKLKRLELEKGAGVAPNVVRAALNAPTTVRTKLNHGKLPAKLKRLELEKGAGVAPNVVGAAPNAPTTVRAKLNHGKLPAGKKPGGAPKKPTTTVRKNTAPGSIPAERPPAPRPKAPTAAAGPLGQTAARNIEKPLPREPTATTARPAATTAATRHTVNTATGNTAGNTTSPTTEAASTSTTAAPTAPAAPPACFHASESATAHEGCPEPPAPQRSYLPVDSSESCEEALAPMFPGYQEDVLATWSLKWMCEERAVAVRLQEQNSRLGTEAGKTISTIKGLPNEKSQQAGGAITETGLDEGQQEQVLKASKHLEPWTGMTEQGVKVQPCWSALSKELVAVLRYQGPVLLGDVGGVYTSVYGKPFRLHGLKLRTCLNNGHLRGIEINSELGRLELEKGARVASNAVEVAPNAPTTVPTKLNIGELPAEKKPGGALKEPTTAVPENTAPCSTAAKRPPAPAVPRPPAPIAAAGPLEPTAARNTDKPLPCEPAATTARPTATAAIRYTVNTTNGNTAGNTTRPATEATSTFPTAVPTVPPAPPSWFRASESATIHEGYPGPPAPQRSYLPVDSSGSRNKAPVSMLPEGQDAFASWPLQGVCEGRAAAVQLEGQKPKIDSATPTLGASLMTFRDEGSCSGGGVGRVVIQYELKEAGEKEVACVAGKNMGLPDYSHPRVVDGRIGSFLGRTNLIEEDTNITTAAAEDANSPLEILRRVPEVFLEEHLSMRNKENLQDLVDIMLDDGCRPKARLRGRGNVFLCSDPSIVVTAQDLDMVVGRLEVDGKFDEDNRAGFPDQLHRISVLRRKDGKIIGLTLRIGRFFKGSAGLIDDLLFPVSNSPTGKPGRAPSILVLGVPGSGKTTVIRDICRKLSATQTVMIVDTSNEIGGGGDTPHREAIGESRRIMVPKHQKQHRVMTEALQNHTPQTIVVDEISDKKEACACLDIKERGVRMVASAHGDLRSILKSLELDTLVGGKTSVTVGDARARDYNGGNKVMTQRAGAPIFDVVIELTSENVDEWSIVRNVGGAVDALLSGRSYPVERRTRVNHDSRSAYKDAGSEDVIFRLAIDKVANRSQDTC